MVYVVIPKAGCEDTMWGDVAVFKKKESAIRYATKMEPGIRCEIQNVRLRV